MDSITVQQLVLLTLLHMQRNAPAGCSEWTVMETA